jgi:4-hydroxybenzoate polyprenyltransferase
VDALPVREDFTAFLEQEKARGREVHLVTAADQALADRVAARIGVFDSVQGSSGLRNLKGSHKRAFLEQRFPDGFVYAGDSWADLQVWRSSAADGLVLVGASSGTARAAARLGKPIEARFDIRDTDLAVWLKAFRLHQWAKNLLVFAPLLLAQMYLDASAVLTATLAFLLMGLVASGTYVLNDLADLNADRRHRTKRQRPFASGRLKVSQGLVVGPGLIAAGMIGAIVLDFGFALWLLAYTFLTISYSLHIKRVALLDVTVLATLFTLRLAMGAAAIEAPYSAWLMTFSMFFFLSLSLAKRHIEIITKTDPSQPNAQIPGRGYFTGDWPLTLAMGFAAGMASIVILVLYVSEDAYPAGLYAHPMFLWAAPMAVGLFVLRIWLLAWRGRLHDDPVAFALKDPLSIALGGAVAAGFLAASAPIAV